MKEKNIESIIKQKSEQLTSEVRPKLWDRLEKRMDDHYQTPQVNRKPDYTWLRIAAGLAIVVGTFFFANKNINTASSETTASNFYMEELQSSDEEVAPYRKMLDFSHEHYQTLINPQKN